MAQEAGITYELVVLGWGQHWIDIPVQFERFAALVAAAERTRTWTQAHWTDYERSIAAAEREECAKVCETYDHADPLGVSTECAAAIRKRGNA
jgi:ribulose 1,5-bisphosphate carboxylase large subunit-like protein